MIHQQDLGDLRVPSSSVRRSPFRSDVDERDSAALMRQILLNEGVEDEEILNRTPVRWVEALREMLGEGHKEWNFTTFESDATNMVIVGPVRFASLCAHHLLPFFGTAHVGYIPQGDVAGLSKLARSVETTALGLWSQEELTDEIMHLLDRKLSPRGVAVVMRAEHTCMSARGARAHDALTLTSSMSGVFLEPTNLARTEFMGLIRA